MIAPASHKIVRSVTNMMVSPRMQRLGMQYFGGKFSNSHATTRLKEVITLNKQDRDLLTRLWGNESVRYPIIPGSKMESIMDRFNIDFTNVVQDLEKGGDPWKNPSQVEHCNFLIKGRKLQFESFRWSLNPSIRKLSLIGASALSHQLFDGKLRYFSTVLIYYSGFGNRVFSNFHQDTYRRSFIWAPNGSATSYTEALYVNGDYGVLLPTRRSGDAMLIPQKDRCSLLDFRVTPDDITCVFKVDHGTIIEIKKGNLEFESAKHALLQGVGSVLHRGGTEKGLVFNISRELPGNGWDETSPL